MRYDNRELNRYRINSGSSGGYRFVVERWEGGRWFGQWRYVFGTDERAKALEYVDQVHDLPIYFDDQPRRRARR